MCLLMYVKPCFRRIIRHKKNNEISINTLRTNYNLTHKYQDVLENISWIKSLLLRTCWRWKEKQCVLHRCDKPHAWVILFNECCYKLVIICLNNTANKIVWVSRVGKQRLLSLTVFRNEVVTERFLEVYVDFVEFGIQGTSKIFFTFKWNVYKQNQIPFFFLVYILLLKRTF